MTYNEPLSGRSPGIVEWNHTTVCSALASFFNGCALYYILHTRMPRFASSYTICGFALPDRCNASWSIPFLS